jgi:hypothetical protein
LNPTIRTPTTGDAGSIRVALDAALYRSLAPSGEEYDSSSVSYLCDDRDYTIQMIVQNIVDAVVINESYLLVFSVVKPWYSKNRIILCEDLVLRIGKGSCFRDVIATMEHLADINECDAIITGGALARSSRAITRLYQRFGFVLEDGSPQLIKRRR